MIFMRSETNLCFKFFYEEVQYTIGYNLTNSDD